MILQNIVIKNFRQYYGEQKVSFSTDKEQNVTLIHGVNGAGKTGLFLALNWALYGSIALEGVGQIPNKLAVEELKPSKILTTAVTLTFLHAGSRFILMRSRDTTKTNGKDLEIQDQFSMSEIPADGDRKPIYNTIGTINSILPENVRTYFLFDGEKIEKFAKPESADDIRNAIYNVLKLEILERGKKHLGDVGKEFQTDLKKVAGKKIEKLTDEVEKITKRITFKKNRLLELEKEILIANSQKREIGDKLSKLQGAKELQQKRVQLESEISGFENRLLDLTELIQSGVNGMAPLLSGPLLDVAIDILEEKRRKGEIPGNIRQQLLNDLIHTKVCICGRPFKEHGKEHQKLILMMTGSISSSVEETVTKLTPDLRVTRSELEFQNKNLSEYMLERHLLIEQKVEAYAKMEDVRNKLKRSSQEDIVSLERKLEDYEDTIKIRHEEVGGIKKSLEMDEIEEGKIRHQLNTEDIEKKKAIILRNKMILAQDASQAIADIYESFANDMRQQIEKETQTIFNSLTWKESQFTNVQLQSDYRLEVIDRWGTPASEELSAGERQVLSLSFIAAMAKVSGEEAPLVMDTPFGRLSSQHRENITANIPQLASQMILFITDEELRDGSHKNLMKKVGEEYHLAFDDTTGCTTIDRSTDVRN